MAQAALTALDTWTARDWRKEERQWREEVRRWRADDVAFRAEERRFKTEERMFRAVRHRWRHEIMQQRHVDNAMHLWNRTKECNRRSVEEKAEHMRAMAWLAAIVGGFTMTAPVEFTYSDPDAPMALVTAYALCTALVPSLMVVAAMIAVFVLGAVLRMGKLYVHEREEEEFLASARYFALNRAAAGGNRTTITAPPAALRSFDRFWDLSYPFFPWFLPLLPLVSPPSSPGFSSCAQFSSGFSSTVRMYSLLPIYTFCFLTSTPLVPSLLPSSYPHHPSS
ncbi:unnamed protein product [Closterium sp. Naga37s-1]|nr:unnamed protein product [Closterium sp. Naga37s-1]